MNILSPLSVIPQCVGSVSLLSSPIMRAASSSGQRMRPSALSRAPSSRTLDFTGRAERSDQEIEENEYFEVIYILVMLNCVTMRMMILTMSKIMSKQ